MSGTRNIVPAGFLGGFSSGMREKWICHFGKEMGRNFELSLDGKEKGRKILGLF